MSVQLATGKIVLTGNTHVIGVQVGLENCAAGTAPEEWVTPKLQTVYSVHRHCLQLLA